MDVNDVIATVKNFMDDPGFRKRNEVMQTRRDLRYAEHAVDVTGISAAAEYRTGLIDENIYHYQTAIRQATFLARAFPNSDSDTDKERAKRANQACVALWADASRRTPGVNIVPLDRCADHQPGDGIGWYHEKISPAAYKVLQKILAGGKAPKELMEEGLDGLPFVVEACDPMTIYYTPDLSMVAQVGAVKTSELLAKYPSLRYDTRQGGYFMTTEPSPPERTDRIWQTTATVYHLETADKMYDVLLNPSRTGSNEGQVLLERENIFGRPSYVPVPGRISGSAEPYKMFQPAVVNMFRIIQQVNVAGTLQQAAARATGKAQYYLRRFNVTGMEPEDWYQNADGSRKILTIGEGGAQLDVPDGYDLVPLQLAAGIDLIRAKADLQGEIMQVAFPLPLRQPSDVRVTSGYDRSRQEEVTSAMLGYLLRHQADAWEDLFALMAAGIEYLGVPVRVKTASSSLAVPGSPAWWVGERREAKSVLVKPEDFKGVDMQAEMSSLSRSARVAMLEEGERMNERGHASDVELLRDFRGVDDVDATLKAIDRGFTRRRAREAVGAMIDYNLRIELGAPVPGPEQPEPESTGARPAAGATSPGVGATLAQPASPGPVTEPGLPGTTG
jgi:hypothetical protein